MASNLHNQVQQGTPQQSFMDLVGNGDKTQVNQTHTSKRSLDLSDNNGDDDGHPIKRRSLDVESIDSNHSGFRAVNTSMFSPVNNPSRQSTSNGSPANSDSAQMTSHNNDHPIELHNDDSQHYQSELLDLSDEEQLRILAEQLESAGAEQGTGPDDQSLIDVSTTRHDTMLNSRELEDQDQEHQEQQHAQHQQQQHQQLPYAISPFTDGHYQQASVDHTALFKMRTLQVLDNVATQILGLIGELTYQEILTMITDADSEMGKIYRNLLHLFEETRNLYTDDIFISYGIVSPYLLRNGNDLIIQRANLVTFAAAIYGTIQVGFYHLNEYFLDTFVQRGGRLLKPQSALYLDLKTQAYISAMGQGEKSQQDILNDLFPHDLKPYLLKYSTDRDQLIPSEHDFIDRCQRRRENLERATTHSELTDKYGWLTFLKDLTEHISRMYNTLIKPGLSSLMLPIRQDTNVRGRPPPGTTFHVWTKDKVERKNNTPRRISLKKGKELRPLPLAEGTVLDTSGGDTFSAYKAAREATDLDLSERKVGGSIFARRHWTTEEEDALLKGLDRVQGPYWSQILELYGPGGSISEVLKDRSQVQLKDKARNLKLFFLKTGTPLPPVFQYVTGDIKRSKGKESVKSSIGTISPLSHSPHQQTVQQHQEFQNRPQMDSQQQIASVQTSQQSQQHHPSQHSQKAHTSPPSTVSPPLQSVNISSPVNNHSASTSLPTEDVTLAISSNVKEVNELSSHEEETAAHLEKLIQSVGEYISNAESHSS